MEAGQFVEDIAGDDTLELTPVDMAMQGNAVRSWL